MFLQLCLQFFDRDSSGHITFEEMRDSNRELEDPLSVSSLKDALLLASLHILFCPQSPVLSEIPSPKPRAVTEACLDGL